ncbi:MAG: c-type cytochrome [Desulfobacteraceae bacterium]
MASELYQLLSSIGYHHPLHPAMTHLPAGLTITCFLFAVLGYLSNRPQFSQTTRHCTILAALSVIPAIIFGYLDWQHFYGGAYIFPIIGKIVLAPLLLLLLCVLIFTGIKSQNVSGRQMGLYFAAFLIVIGLGFLGGELVFKNQAASDQGASDHDHSAHQTPLSATASGGKALFEKKCAACHLAKSTQTKVGPGLKGLYNKEKMPVSGWPVTEENLERQLKNPFDQMPAFDQLTDEEIKTLTDYIKTL